MKIPPKQFFYGRIFRSFIPLIFFATLSVYFCHTALPVETAREGVVSRVIDGDTFDLAGGERVRLIGVNSPEYEPWKNIRQSFGKEASDYARKLLNGKKVRLEFDTQTLDRYGRTLAYVYLEDGQFVNRLLAQEGYAKAKSYPPNNRYREVFNQSQKEAKKNKKGLWARSSL